MALAGLGAIWLGGLVFAIFVSVASGLIIWEISRMLVPERGGKFSIIMGVLGAIIVLGAGFLPALMALFLSVIAVISALAGAIWLGKETRGRGRFMIYIGWILLAGYGLTALRETGGAGLIFWLVAVVVATDTAGYFVGKTFGGPKFWPRVSPKKTWSGTIGGWLAAAVVGLAFGGPMLALLSAILAFASQMGDAAESALKRHTGTKDSSNLIPGHGGVFDRFDSMMGVALLLTLFSLAGWNF